MSAERLSFVEFCARVVRVRLTRAQTVFALVAFDRIDPRDLPAADRELARALFGDVRKVARHARAVVCAVLGARSGKSWLAALRLLHLALTVDLSRLAAGEVAAGIIVAPDTRLARQTLRYVVGAVRSSPALAHLLVAQSADALLIERPDGKRVSIEALPATRGGSAVRGRTLVGAVLDESAFFLDSANDYVVNDEEVFRAVSPRVLRDGQTLVVSTPWTRSGLLYEVYTDNFGRPRGALAARAGTLVMRDHAPDVAAVVEREQRRDEANAAREYDAQFVDASASLLASGDIEACVERGVVVHPPRADVLEAGAYGLTLDVGLRNDATAALVVHVESKSRGPGAPPLRQLVVDCVVHLKPSALRRVSLDAVEEAVADLAGRYRVGRVHGDVHLADALAPRLAMRGLAYAELPMTPAAQQVRAATLASAVSSHAVRLLDHEATIAELKDLRITRHPGGRVSVGAPESKKRHDDLADCLLLAAEVSAGLPAVGGDAGRVEFLHEGLTWDDEGLSVRGGRWVRVHEDGRRELTGVPPWAPEAAAQYEDWRAQGIYTPESLAYFAQRGAVGEDPPGMSVPVQHEDAAPRERARGGFEWGPGSSTSSWAFGDSRKK